MHPNRYGDSATDLVTVKGGAKLYQQSRSKWVTGFENSRTLKFKVSGFEALPTGIWVSRT
jgi:hypothetical protein